MKIITGHTGQNHVTSADDRGLHAGTFGTGSYVLNVNDKFAAEIISANKIRIASGEAIHQGTHMRIPHSKYDDVTIENGTTGYKRKDLIVARYTVVNDIEDVSLVVIKGSASYSDPVVPDYVHGNILEGNPTSDMPLYVVELDGVNVSKVTPQFKVINKGLDEVYSKEETYNKSEVYNKSETYSKTETYKKSELIPKENFVTAHVLVQFDSSKGLGVSEALPECFTTTNTFLLGFRKASGSGTLKFLTDNEITYIGLSETSGKVYAEIFFESLGSHKQGDTEKYTLLFVRK